MYFDHLSHLFVMLPFINLLMRGLHKKFCETQFILILTKSEPLFLST